MRRLLLPLILLTLACQTVTQGFSPDPTAAISPIPAATATGQVFSTAPAPSPTPPLTHSPSPTPSLTLAPALPASAQQLEIFEELWDIVNEEYLYEDFNGVDWIATGHEYRALIQNGLTDEDFYLAMDEMIASLGDEHSTYISPEQAAEEDAEYAGNLDYVGIGVYIMGVPDRNRAVIIFPFPGGPAEQMGLQSRDSILAVDGVPILDEEGYMRDIVRGPEDTSVTLTVQTPGQPPREVVVARTRISSAMPVPYQVIVTESGKRIGYILIVTFADGTVDEQVGDALEAMMLESPLDGLIIDNRLNEGGADSVLKGTLAYFTGGELGYFISREDARPLRVRGKDLNGTQALPLVVLIGTDTVSYGEVFAGVLRDNGRAYLIGETTLGNVETLWGYDFEDNSRAWIAHDSFRPFFHPDEDWEQTGIIPHLTILANWDEYTFETDPVIDAARDYLEMLGTE